MRILLAICAFLCFGFGVWLLSVGASTAGFTFIIAACIGALAWSSE